MTLTKNTTLTSGLLIRPASWQHDQTILRFIREQVFVHEQNVPVELECDEHDDRSYHWLAVVNKRIVACCRMQKNGHIGRMAVLAEYRNNGIGLALLQAALSQARQDNLFESFLYAQTHALGFYQAAGFIRFGEEFSDAGIPHYGMRLRLSEQRQLGLHGGNFSIDNFPASALELIQQTSQQLRILSYRLDHTVFDNNAIANCLSSLARKSRHTEIRLLIVDSQPIIRHGHRLLSLHRRLSSSILLRRCTALPHDIKDNLIIADQSGLICQSIRDTDKVWGNYNNQPIVANYITQFDDLWGHAVADKNLRLLDI